MADMGRLVEQREAAKAEAKTLRSQLAAIQGAEADAANAAVMTELATLREEKATRAAADETAKTEAQRSDGRKKIVDTILDGAHPDHAETLRLMLPGLHEAQEIDLYSDTPDDAGLKAREKLIAKYPSFFGAKPGDEQAGQPGHPGVNVEGVRVPTDLDGPAMLRLPQEQFDQLFGGTGNKDFGV